MKIMVASDIHGSAYYCEKMLERYKIENADRLVLLGDILYHGPRNALPKDYSPKVVAQFLNVWKDEILSVRGNCDSEVDQMVLDFPIMADYGFLCLGSKTFYITHGHIFGPDNPPPMKSGDVLLCGHTHIPAFIKYDNFTYINPGSVSIPKDNSQHGYLIIDENQIRFKTIDGDEYMAYSMSDF